jgi:hypothetical protein
MVERRSRFQLYFEGFRQEPLEVSTAIITALHPHRESAHILTYDNGKEFARRGLIDEILGSTGYFAHPLPLMGKEPKRKHQRPDPAIFPKAHRLRKNYRRASPGNPGPSSTTVPENALAEEPREK